MDYTIKMYHNSSLEETKFNGAWHNILLADAERDPMHPKNKNGGGTPLHTVLHNRYPATYFS